MQKQLNIIYRNNYTPFLMFFNVLNTTFNYNLNMSFKENLKAELEYQGIQLKELELKTGISKNTIGNYLTGHNSVPAADNAVKIAQALGVSVEYLVTGTDLKNTKISSFPIKYRKIIENLELLDDKDLEAILALVEVLKTRKTSS